MSILHICSLLAVFCVLFFTLGNLFGCSCGDDDDDDDDVDDDDDDDDDDDNDDDDTGDDDDDDNDDNDDDDDDFQLNFNGLNGKASTTGGYSPQISGSFTVEGFFKFAAAAPAELDYLFYFIGPPADKVVGGFTLSQHSTTGKIDFEYYASGGVKSTESSAQPLVGSWVHIAGVLKWEVLKDDKAQDYWLASLYVNGTLVGENKFGSDGLISPVAATNWSIGAGEYDGYFDGSVTQFRISNSAKYSGTSITVPTELTADAGTVALYRFDLVGAGSTVPDTSSNSNDLTLTGGATWSIQ